MDRRNIRRKGFTLVELVIVLRTCRVIIHRSVNLVLLGTRTQKVTVDEYTLQSGIRWATEQVNQIVRLFQSGFFAVLKLLSKVLLLWILAGTI